MRRRKREISEGIFDEQDRRQEAGGILGHRSITPGVLEQFAQAFVGMEQPFTGDLQILINGADDQCDNGQDDN
jgi:hypothetical protein